MNLEQITTGLAGFASIELHEMDRVKLMDRTDTKYVFRSAWLFILLEQLKEDYRVLDVNGIRISRYESLYFDTKDFDLYLSHHRGKPNRFKIRFRKYVESELDFFEVKVKNNKGRTVKSRVKQAPTTGTINEKAKDLLIEKTNLDSEQLEPKLWVNYSRITLVNKKSTERVTIDLYLTFKNNEQSKTIDDLVIAEVKQDKAFTSPFVRLMKKHHIREGSISKYCYGVISLFDIKHNNFKQVLNRLKKILNSNYDIITGS